VFNGRVRRLLATCQVVDEEQLEWPMGAAVTAPIL